MWGISQTRTPHIQARGAPSGPPHVAPTARKTSSQERPLWGRWWVLTPTPPQPQPVGSAPRLHARRTGGREWENAQTRTPHTHARGAFPLHLRATPQRAKPIRKSARCEVGGGSPGPPLPHPQPVDSGPRPHAPRKGCREWESALTRTPHTQARGAAPGRPRAAPPARKASSQERAL